MADEGNESEDYYDSQDSMDDDDYDDSDSDAELDDIDMEELEEMAASTARSLFMVQMQLATQNAAEVEESFGTDQRSPHEKWQDLLAHLSKTKVLKITDKDTTDMTMDDLQKTSPLLDDLMSGIRQHSGLTHAILGGRFLQSFQEKQSLLFEAIWKTHCHTLTYLKLGSKEIPASLLDIGGLLSILCAPSAGPQPLVNFNLTEMELNSFVIDSPERIDALQAALCRASSLKQINLLGIEISADVKKTGLMDQIFNTLAHLAPLDECRICCVNSSPFPLITATCLEETLTKKPKWWRLGLDGVGLDDDHCRVMAKAMTNEKCKAGDLLSLTLNPAITHEGFDELFSILFQKQRMGLVKVDNPTWQANFDLVRSMNNLHSRLDYLEKSGSYASRIRWLEWLAKLSQITWEDEAHKVNYLWFTILERPDFVHL